MSQILIYWIRGASLHAVRRMFNKTHKLQRWVEGYRDGKLKSYPSAANTHYEWLLLFMEVVDKEIYDIDGEDVGRFIVYVNERYSHPLYRMDAIRALHCFCRYWNVRGHKYLGQIAVLIKRHLTAGR